ncbi:MAG: NADH-quinone oxidoreductase subunit NuoG [Lysobacteraceae bacterium]|jgi:NADH-quinone oxidoreductase subunit G|nr:NADH-quinone oxidoreductase subunit NuoG [Xanthomonadaceae bacterium]MCZ8317672.1 NADH-quinone oxidoreductase subunit NuoG [Silanimonas sp.]
MSAATPTAPATDLVNIEIDGVPMQAPKGSMIIQAADKAGIAIPRFCYHKKLPIAANCRMCLVDVEKMPKPAPACATPVMEGMKVTTQTKRALDAQRNVMEFLLVNHPLDCPICDQGGECELQDVSMGYGRSVSRYVERKRVVADEDLGPLVATEMTRCIHCTRCVRFTADVAGTYELGGMYRGENLQIGTYDGKPLTTELSGNVIDVCPVGALTNKVFRFKARPWELVARESIGLHDALGSNLFLHVRRGDVLRIVPRDNEAVNECWLSDRDRYSHEGLYSDDRATTPLAKQADGSWKAIGWDEAIAQATLILRAAGPRLGVLVHPSTSNEEGASLARLAAGLGSAHVDHRIGLQDLADAPVAEPFARSVADLETADVVVLVGSNLRHEVPLLHQRLLKATKKGARVFAINPVDFAFSHPIAGKVVVAPSKLPGVLAALAARVGASLPSGIATPIEDPALDGIVDALRSAKAGVLLLGEIAERHATASHVRAAARAVAQATGVALNRIPQGANALGLSQHGVLPGQGGEDAKAQLLGGKPAYLLHNIEPAYDFADATTALKALSSAKVVALSAWASDSLKQVADLILPIAAGAEAEGLYTNLDGRVQAVQAGGKPRGDARPGWRVLRALGESLQLRGFDHLDLDGLRSGLAAHRVAPGQRLSAAPVIAPIERLATTPIYRADAQLRRSEALNAHPLTRGQGVDLHPEDAAALGLGEGTIAKVADANGHAALPVRLDPRLARGTAWIESAYPATAPLAAHGALSITKAGA